MFPQKHVFTLVKLKSQIHRSQTDVVVEFFLKRHLKSRNLATIAYSEENKHTF